MTDLHELYTKPSAIVVQHRLDVLEQLVKTLGMRLSVAQANVAGFNVRLRSLEDEVAAFDKDLKTLADEMDEKPETKDA